MRGGRGGLKFGLNSYMESRLLTWVVITSGIFFCFFASTVECQLFAFTVEYQQQNIDNAVDGQQQQLSHTQFISVNLVSSPPPPPPPPPPPSPSLQPPSHSPLPPLPHPPPPPRNGLPFAPPKNGNSTRNHNPHNAHAKLSPPPPPEKKLKFGKKIGLFFVGIAAILQVCVVAFLVIKRRQLFRAGSSF